MIYADPGSNQFFDNIRHPKKRAFLRAYCETFSITRSAAAVGIHRDTHYEWLKADPDYVKAFREVLPIACDGLEAEAVSRAKDGLRSYKFYQGKPIMISCPEDHPEVVDLGEGENPRYVRHYYECSYSDSLLIFLLKAAMPEKYREHYPYRHDEENIIERAKKLVDKLADQKAAEILAEHERAGTVHWRVG